MKYVISRLSGIIYSMGERYKSYGMLGKKHSSETRKRMSESHKKKPTSYWLGKTMSAEHKKKLSEGQKGRTAWNKGLKGWNAGEKNPMWKGGISPMNSRLRNTLEYKAWRKSVFERDNYTCVLCGARSKKGERVELNADHIKPFAYFPDSRLDIDNGRTLCVPCHKGVSRLIKLASAGDL